jgi:hypothetical protein
MIFRFMFFPSPAAFSGRRYNFDILSMRPAICRSLFLFDQLMIPVSKTQGVL